MPGLVTFAALVACWQLLAEHNADFIPSVPATAAELWDNPRLFGINTLVTLREVAVGTGASFVVAFSLAVLMCQARLVERALMPVAVVVNVTPVVSYAPVFVLLFGFGSTPRYIVTAIVVFFPLLVNALAGLRSVDPEVFDVMETLHASRWEILWRLRLPSSVPFLLAAARVCLPLGVVGAVVAEFVASGSSSGLGSMIFAALETNQKTVIYGAILVLVAIGLALTAAVSVAERRLLAWREGGASERGPRPPANRSSRRRSPSLVAPRRGARRRR